MKFTMNAAMLLLALCLLLGGFVLADSPLRQAFGLPPQYCKHCKSIDFVSPPHTSKWACLNCWEYHEYD